IGQVHHGALHRPPMCERAMPSEATRIAVVTTDRNRGGEAPSTSPDPVTTLRSGCNRAHHPRGYSGCRQVPPDPWAAPTYSPAVPARAGAARRGALGPRAAPAAAAWGVRRARDAAGPEPRLAVRCRTTFRLGSRRAARGDGHRLVAARRRR